MHKDEIEKFLVMLRLTRSYHSERVDQIDGEIEKYEFMLKTALEADKEA